MKKSLKKLSLNKKIVSNLVDKAIGGRIRQITTDDPIDPFTSTDPTKLTWCYHCPVNDPF